MKLFRYLLPLLAVFMTASLYAQIETDTMDIESEPFEELEEAERRAAAETAKGGISITADVRLKWIPQLKDNLGYHTRGTGAVNPVEVPGAYSFATAPAGTRILAPTSAFQAEANIYMDYDNTCDWVETQFQFKLNRLGVNSSSDTNVNLRKAWVGYSFYKDSCSEFYVELGRKAMSNIFDSRVQFDSSFDGILFVYERTLCVGPLKVDGGPFIIDYRNSHYGWAGEAYLNDIMDTPFFAKYAFIHWRKKGADFFGVYDSPRFRFVNSQVMLGYNFLPNFFGFEGQEGCLYGAWLINHAAEKVLTSAYTRANQGWYICFEYGKIGKAGDYLFDICYQEVGYQAVPSYDVSGIGRGNATSRGDLPATEEPLDTAFYINPQDVLTLPAIDAEGNSNYRGVEFRSYYSVTDNAVLKATTSYSLGKNVNIGGKNKFLKFELQVLYEF